MYLYKAACSEIPNLKPKGVQKAIGDRAQTRISRENSWNKAYPIMCWSGLRTNTHLELKHLEEFLNTHAVSLQDSVPAVTGMVYRYIARYHSLRVLGFSSDAYPPNRILFRAASNVETLLWGILSGTN